MIKVFSQDWFLLHQAGLLRFANTRIGRLVLGIDGESSSVGDHKILAILPDSITWQQEGGKLTTEFRTHDKFAKRLYYTFRPLWWTFHGWDMLIANRINLSWNLGFDTTPDLLPAAGANAPADGYVERNLGAVGGNSFSDLVTGAGTGNGETSGADRCGSVTAGTTTDMFRRVLRGGFGFDTGAAIGDSDTIDTAVLSLSPTGKANGLGSPDLHVVSFAPANTANFANTDYANFGTTSYGSIAYASWTADGGYDAITLNADGEGHISTTSYTFFGTRIAWDKDNSFGGTWASAGDTNFQCIYADTAGTGRDPKLVVTYTPAGGGTVVKDIIGMGIIPFAR